MASLSKPFKHGKKEALIIMRHMEPELIRKPHLEYAKAHRQFAEHAVTVMLLLTLVVVGLLLGPQWTGEAISATRLNVSQPAPNDCNFYLYPGLNYISYNCISNYHEAETLFNNTDLASYVAIYSYTPGNADKWQVFTTRLPSYVVSDLERFSREKGYIVWINESSTGSFFEFYYSGILAAGTDISVPAGYSLVGYPRVLIDPILQGLTTINDTFTSVLHYNHTSIVDNETNTTSDVLQRRYYHIDVGGNLTRLSPNEGYWLNMSQADTWHVYRNQST